MILKKINKEEVSEYLEGINHIAYSDDFAKFAQNAYGSQRSLVGIFEGNELKAFLPVFEKNDYGQTVAEVPLFIYAEIFFTDKNYKVSGSELGSRLIKLLNCDVLRLNIYEMFFIGNFDHSGMEDTFSAMIIDLSRVDNYEDFLKNVLSKNSRSKIYKSESSGLDFCHLNRDDFSEFYSLYSEHVASLGSKPRPREYFENMINAYSFGQNLFMFGVRLEGRLISANLFIVEKDYMEVRFLADDRRYHNLFANNFLYAQMFKWAYEHGIKFIDLGGIPRDMKTNIEFKMSFGAKEYPIYTKYLFRDVWQKLIFKLTRKFIYFKKYRNLMLRKLKPVK